MNVGPFEPAADGGMAVSLSVVEADAIRQVAQDLIDELGAPNDPGLRRLFPPAYEDDVEAQAEYESITREDLERAKVQAAQRVISSIKTGERRRGRWTGSLDSAEQHAWLAVINDARLVLGTRLEVTEDEPRLPRRHPNAPLMDLYMYLGGLEEALVLTLTHTELGETPEHD